MDKILRDFADIGMRLTIFLVLLAALSTVTDSSHAQQRDSYLSSAELKRILQTEDTYQIVEALNRAKRSQESPQLMSFLLRLWNRSERSPDLPWSVMENPRIRIEIANVLIQASNNGLIEFDRNEARAYSRQIATGSDDDAKTTAVLNLGLIASDEDIALLKKIAITEDRETFRPAVISIARMCGPGSEKALAEIKARVRRGDHRDFVSKPAVELAPFKRCPADPARR